GVPDTIFEDEDLVKSFVEGNQPDKKIDKSEDPFNIYSFLNRKNPLEKNVNVSDSSLKCPSGFTPSVRNSDEVEGRIAWVEVAGIPFRLWSGNTFACIADKWGKLLDVDGHEETCFHSKRLCIHMKSAIETLNVILIDAKSKHLFRGIDVGKDKVNVSHLQFADDALIITEWSKTNIKNLSRILTCFHLAFGLKVNFNKSKIFCIGVSGPDLNSFASSIGCQPSHFSKDSSWKAKSLSFGGRLTLSKFVLGSLEISCIAWVKVISTLAHGGLGIGSLKISNLEKWVGNSPLCYSFTMLFRLESQPNCRVCDRVSTILTAAPTSCPVQRDDGPYIRPQLEPIGLHTSSVWPSGLSRIVEFSHILKKELEGVDSIIDIGQGNEEVINTRSGIIHQIQKCDSLDSMEMAQMAKIKWAIEGYENSSCKVFFFLHSDLPKGCNSSFIALIPKIPDANLVKDFRPISLIGSIYKIIAKFLTNRLVGVLGGIINEVQSAFIEDRQILDGPFILNEVISWCKRKRKQTLIFKVDFEKAYDSVRWDFLDEVLRNGVSTLFWDDGWCEGGRLKDRFPRAYALETCKRITVRNKLVHPNLTHSFRRDPRGGVEQSQVEELAAMLHSVILNHSQDRWTRSLNKSGEYTVASARSLIDLRLLPKGDLKTRWIRYVPIKVNTLAWKVISIPYLVSIVIWGWTLRIIFSLLVIWQNKLPTKNKNMLEGVFFVMWWLLWNFRNKKMFEDKVPSKATFLDERSRVQLILLTNGLYDVGLEAMPFDFALCFVIRSSCCGNAVLGWIVSSVIPSIAVIWTYRNCLGGCRGFQAFP
nr:cysteine-rich receptor-like protein kinase [Tanacetum cinerariifolium]